MLLTAGILLAAFISLYFSILSYALRDYSRGRLEALLAARGKAQWYGWIHERNADLIFVTAAGRLLANILIVVGVMRLMETCGLNPWGLYLVTIVVALTISLTISVAIPTAVALYAGEVAIAASTELLYCLWFALSPLTRLMRWLDTLARNMAGRSADAEPEHIEEEILQVVEEGQKEGVVDQQERQMIESVIEFRDRQVGQIMTARPAIVALELGATLADIKRTIEESGHSRIPVYDGTLDHIAGVLYARDLLRHLGTTSAEFDIRSAMRPAVFVHETKPLRDLLLDFRLQKVHMAIVLDEYGGTIGLVTIEDILEELVGEISDEHEPQEPAMFRKLDESTFEADARLRIDEFNRQTGLSLSEDAGYDTLGGFVSTVLGKIPAKGTSFEQNGVRYTIVDAEPQRVKWVKVELLAQSAG